MYKIDPLLNQQRDAECYLLLHRAAGMRGYSCDPKKSHIDGRYFAEINYYVGKGVLHANIKMGTGDTPMEAAIDGYRQIVPLDDTMAVLYLECELFLLSETARIFEVLDKTLADLATIVDAGKLVLD